MENSEELTPNTESRGLRRSQRVCSSINSEELTTFLLYVKEKLYLNDSGVEELNIKEMNHLMEQLQELKIRKDNIITIKITEITEYINQLNNILSLKEGGANNSTSLFNCTENVSKSINPENINTEGSKSLFSNNNNFCVMNDIENDLDMMKGDKETGHIMVNFYNNSPSQNLSSIAENLISNNNKNINVTNITELVNNIKLAEDMECTEVTEEHELPSCSLKRKTIENVVNQSMNKKFHSFSCIEENTTKKIKKKIPNTFVKPLNNRVSKESGMGGSCSSIFSDNSEFYSYHLKDKSINIVNKSNPELENDTSDTFNYRNKYVELFRVIENPKIIQPEHEDLLKRLIFDFNTSFKKRINILNLNCYKLNSDTPSDDDDKFNPFFYHVDEIEPSPDDVQITQIEKPEDAIERFKNYLLEKYDDLFVQYANESDSVEIIGKMC